MRSLIGRSFQKLSKHPKLWPIWECGRTKYFMVLNIYLMFFFCFFLLLCWLKWLIRGHLTLIPIDCSNPMIHIIPSFAYAKSQPIAPIVGSRTRPLVDAMCLKLMINQIVFRLEFFSTFRARMPETLLNSCMDIAQMLAQIARIWVHFPTLWAHGTKGTSRWVTLEIAQHWWFLLSRPCNRTEAAKNDNFVNPPKREERHSYHKTFLAIISHAQDAKFYHATSSLCENCHISGWIYYREESHMKITTLIENATKAFCRIENKWANIILVNIILVDDERAWKLFVHTQIVL